MVKEFVDFLKHYGVVGLAIAVIIGGKMNDFVSAVVNGLLMPIVGAATSAAGGDWRTWVLPVGPIQFEVGKVLGAGIDFVIVAFIVFWMAKTILREEKVTKK